MNYTLHMGDCLEYLRHFPDGCVAAVITDPPYGLELGITNNQEIGGRHLHKAAYAQYDDTYANFVGLIVPRLRAVIKTGRRAAIFTGPHIQEQPKATAIGGIYHPAATGRTPWGSKNFLPILFYGNHAKPGQHRPTVLYSTSVAEQSEHPCPKPLEWMRWLVNLATDEGDTVFDPFMGSGTTGVACMQTGRNFIGCEISEEYYRIAEKRIREAASQLRIPFDSTYEDDDSSRTTVQGSLY